MVKPSKLKFKVNITINKRVMCTNFGDLRSRDRELRHKKLQILASKVIKSRIIKKKRFTCKTEIWAQCGYL